jgi:hypothetical protein
MHRATYAAAAALALLVMADLGRAQTVRQQTDSIRAETCRGGTLSASGLTCTGATAAGRVTVYRRLANRIDSITNAVPPVAFVENFYNSPRLFYPVEGVDTVTVCAVVQRGAARKLVWPPVRMRVLGDSATYGLRGGNPLAQMCADAAAMRLTSTDSVPGTWGLERVVYEGRTLWRPFAIVP